MFTEQSRYGNDPSVVLRTKTWDEPLKWQRLAQSEGVKKMVFTCSWSDWFHKDADGWRDEAWAVVRKCPNLIFQILTKRPERIHNHLPADWGRRGYENVWLGSSVDMGEKNGMALFMNPASVLFLSIEPLISEVKLEASLLKLLVSWVIVGGESGPHARLCKVEWIHSIVEKCKSVGVPCFVKQLGAKSYTENANVFDWPDGIAFEACGTPFAAGYPILSDRKGGNIEEWPEELRVRQFPHH